MKRKLQLLVYSLLGFLYMKGLIGPVKWSWGDKPAKYLLQMLYAVINKSVKDVPGMCAVIQNLLHKGLLDNGDYYDFVRVLESIKPSLNNEYSHYTEDPLWKDFPYWWESYNNKPRLEFLKEVIQNEY